MRVVVLLAVIALLGCGPSSVLQQPLVQGFTKGMTPEEVTTQLPKRKPRRSAEVQHEGKAYMIHSYELVTGQTTMPLTSCGPNGCMFSWRGE